MLGFQAPGVQAFLQGPATPAPQQSTTGPTPPLAVLLQDARKPADSLASLASEVTLNVPAYLWRHGCGPTAVGMVLGYYDGLGFGDLIPGSAITQTEAVNQAIASGGDISSPNPPGSEAHYEDYARPEDDPPPMITDDYFTSGRTPHPDDSIADYMHTSQSSFNNLYGWSWSYDIGPAFVAFVNQQNSSYVASYQEYFYSDGTANGTLTWSVLTGEIDAGRPMIFLVDSDGDGATDHFMPVIGYRTSPSLQYGAWDTWDAAHIRWQNFTGLAQGTPWGIMGALALYLNPGSPTATATPTSTPTPTPTPTQTPTAMPSPTPRQSDPRALFNLFLPVLVR